MSMSTSFANLSAAVSPPTAPVVKSINKSINLRELGLSLPISDKIHASGRTRYTDAEMLMIVREHEVISKALRYVMEQGAADPAAAVREMVQISPAREYDTRNMAMMDAFRAVEDMFHITTAADASRRNIARADSARTGANEGLLADLDHVTARENGWLNLLFGRLNLSAALLERDFIVAGNILEGDTPGNRNLGAFEISHEKYGKLLALDALGNVTLFDRSGNALDTDASVSLLLRGTGGPFATPATDNRAPIVDRML